MNGTYSITNEPYTTIFSSSGAGNVDIDLDITVDKTDTDIYENKNNATGNLEICFGLPNTASLSRDICMNSAGNFVNGYHTIIIATAPENASYKWLMDFDLTGITWNSGDGDIFMTLYGTEHATNVVETIPLAHYTENNALDYAYDPCSFNFNELQNTSFANDARNSRLKLINGTNILYFLHEWKYSDITAVLNVTDFTDGNSILKLRELDMLPGTVLSPAAGGGGEGISASVVITGSGTTGILNTPTFSTIEFSKINKLILFHLEADWQGAITTDGITGELIVELVGLPVPKIKNIVDVKYQLPVVNGFEIAVKGEIYDDGGRVFIKVKVVYNNLESFVNITNNGSVEMDGKYFIA